ncbi:MAG: dTMP kinase [Candidatus Levybacteria bacterium]|nr:dTMP kinase [Candidatus Levybacteria bacterium]
MKYHIEFDIDFRRNPYNGSFIALEGIDGSGKSTQAQLLKEALEKKNRKVVVKNPFEGEIGAFVRTILAGEKRVSAISLQYLISANRAAQQEEIIKDLKDGCDVIIDRYFWSAVAYAILDHPSIDKKDMKQWLLIGQSILSHYHQFLLPDMTFFLDISSRTATKRLDSMEKEKEIYEEESKIKKIEKIYEWLVGEFPKEFVTVNGEQPIEKVTQELLMHISSCKKN